MLKEFKEFALRGNLVDIAIGFVMGAAFKEVVGALTGGIISPLVGLIFKTDFKDLKYIIQKTSVASDGSNIKEIAVHWGQFVTATIDFIIIAFVMFMIVKLISKLKNKNPEIASGPSNNSLLIEIRDLLKKV